MDRALRAKRGGGNGGWTGCALTRRYTNHIRFIYSNVKGHAMGIVKIGEEMHEELRRASAVMCRSINAQAEFWMKIGMLAEANPGLSFTEIVRMQLAAAEAAPAQREAA